MTNAKIIKVLSKQILMKLTILKQGLRQKYKEAKEIVDGFSIKEFETTGDFDSNVIDLGMKWSAIRKSLNPLDYGVIDENWDRYRLLSHFFGIMAEVCYFLETSYFEMTPYNEEDKSVFRITAKWLYELNSAGIRYQNTLVNLNAVIAIHGTENAIIHGLENEELDSPSWVIERIKEIIKKQADIITTQRLGDVTGLLKGIDQKTSAIKEEQKWQREELSKTSRGVDELREQEKAYGMRGYVFFPEAVRKVLAIKKPEKADNDYSDKRALERLLEDKFPKDRYGENIKVKNKKLVKKTDFLKAAVTHLSCWSYKGRKANEVVEEILKSMPEVPEPELL